MRNVQKLIDAKGGLVALKSRPIRLDSPGFMRLVIEHVGHASIIPCFVGERSSIQLTTQHSPLR